MLRLILQTNGSREEVIVKVIFYAVAVLLSLILHEIAHGLVALWCGDPSAKLAGRLSLNPARHLDPFGTLSFLLFGLGWANPVPVNPRNFRRPKLGCVLVSVAGIAVNLLLGFVASFFWVLLGTSIWSYFFQYLMSVNVVLAVFNLLPIAPLDGFNLIASLCPQSAYVRFLRQNQLFAMALLVGVTYFTSVLALLESGVVMLFLDFWHLFL